MGIYEYQIPVEEREASYLLAMLTMNLPKGNDGATVPISFTSEGITGQTMLVLVGASPLTLEQRRFLTACGLVYQLQP